MDIAPKQKMQNRLQKSEEDDLRIKIKSRQVDLISAQIGVTAENGERFELYYQLMESVRCPADNLTADNGSKAGDICYSVMISEYCGGVCRDSSLAYDITDEKEKAFGLFRTLVNGTVTPCTLFYVLEDIL